MDLGATICTRSKPICEKCPLENHCVATNKGMISILPTPKPAKRLPAKHLVFLLLRNNQNQTLLEKRPPSGIWGGLWSLPEFGSLESAHNWCTAKNISVDDVHTLPIQRHTFSHYHLDFTPVIFQTENPINFVMEANQSVWYNAEQIDTLGLPAPIKKLLQQHTRGKL